MQSNPLGKPRVISISSLFQSLDNDSYLIDTPPEERPKLLTSIYILTTHHSLLTYILIVQIHLSRYKRNAWVNDQSESSFEACRCSILSIHIAAFRQHASSSHMNIQVHIVIFVTRALFVATFSSLVKKGTLSLTALKFALLSLDFSLFPTIHIALLGMAPCNRSYQ